MFIAVNEFEETRKKTKEAKGKLHMLKNDTLRYIHLWTVLPFPHMTRRLSSCLQRTLIDYLIFLREAKLLHIYYLC